MSLAEISVKHQALKPPYYLSVYESYLAPLTASTTALLELGVNRGGSLELWAEYFPRATVVGIDIKDIVEIDQDWKPIYKNGRPVLKTFSSSRIVSKMGSQADEAFLTGLSSDYAPRGWDIIIDDCSHVGSLSLQSFLTLFPLLKIGGLYIVEDWGVGYKPDFAEGEAFDTKLHLTEQDGKFPSHASGLAGFIKQLVDEVGMDDINALSKTGRPAVVDWMHVYKGAVIIKKRRNVPSLRFPA